MFHLLRQVSFFFVLGCGLTSVSPLFSQSITNASVTGRTQVFTFELVDSPCLSSCPSGEDMLLNGSIHLIVHTSTDSNGGIHTSVKQAAQGVKGIGVNTQTKYEFIQTAGTSLNESGNAPYEITMVTRLRVIGPGGNNNYFINGVSHLSINANGEITATFDKFNTDCTR